MSSGLPGLLLLLTPSGVGRFGDGLGGERLRPLPRHLPYHSRVRPWLTLDGAIDEAGHVTVGGGVAAVKPAPSVVTWGHLWCALVGVATLCRRTPLPTSDIRVVRPSSWYTEIGCCGLPEGGPTATILLSSASSPRWQVPPRPGRGPPRALPTWLPHRKGAIRRPAFHLPRWMSHRCG